MKGGIAKIVKRVTARGLKTFASNQAQPVDVPIQYPSAKALAKVCCICDSSGVF